MSDVVEKTQEMSPTGTEAKRVPFGEEPVIAFLHAKDAELTAVRTILSGRRAGLDEAMIWERLREEQERDVRLGVTPVSVEERK